MCKIIAWAVSGSTSLLPKNVVPGVTVSRFVPSESISESRFAWLEDDTPTTATIAPIPIAIPSAERAARSRRWRSPWTATENSSCGGILATSLPGSSLGPRARRRHRSPPGVDSATLKAVPPDHSLGLVLDDLAVAHVQPPRERAGDVLVMRDQRQRRAFGRELVQQLDHLSPGLRVEVPG